MIQVEQLERDVAELQQALADKQEQDNAMIQVLMRVEQEQKVTEDARRYAKKGAAAQRYATEVLQEKYETATTSLAKMEKRVVMAESMLEATLQYQSCNRKLSDITFVLSIMYREFLTHVSIVSTHKTLDLKSIRCAQTQLPLHLIDILTTTARLPFRHQHLHHNHRSSSLFIYWQSASM